MSGGSRGPYGSEDGDTDVDHYAVLGLPSGEEGAGLSLKDIERAYRQQSRIRHPDKRPDDPNATADFQRLTESFDVLKDEMNRRAFDARLRARRERVVRNAALSSKRQKMATDLEERERAAESATETRRTEKREKDMAAKLKEELQEFQARKAKKFATATTTSSNLGGKREESEGIAVDKGKMLKVSWERKLGNYTAERLREIFQRFGEVEDVVIRSNTSKKKGSAIVVMSSKDAAVTAVHSMSGEISNPLLVLPFQDASASMSSPFPTKSAEPIDPKFNNIYGAGFQDFETYVLNKLQKANEQKQKTP